MAPFKYHSLPVAAFRRLLALYYDMWRTALVHINNTNVRQDIVELKHETLLLPLAARVFAVLVFGPSLLLEPFWDAQGLAN